jgi:hypothetical protein
MQNKNQFKLKIQTYSNYLYMFLINYSDINESILILIKKFKIPFFYSSKSLFLSAFNKLNLQKSFFLYTNDINILLLFENISMIC